MPKKLDSNLLDKMQAKTRKSKQYLREQVSRRASRNAISSVAAQLLWARELGIGITSVLDRAGPSVRDEVRLIPNGRSVSPIVTRTAPNNSRHKKGLNLGLAVDFLLRDSELHDRCRDLLTARKHYDRALREATTVLDDRLKKLSGISNMNPADLVGKVLNPDPAKAVIVLSAENREQEGFFLICKGLMQTARNTSHHKLTDAFTQADALSFCGFVDTLLAVLGQGQIYGEPVKDAAS